MYDPRYQIASALLYDPQSSMRYNTRVALLNIGFGEVEAVHDYSEFVTRAKTGNFDLVIGDARSNGGDTCDLVRKIRHNDLGWNPFTNFIVTIWDTSPDQVNAIIDSGADDLISRPMSNAMLCERVTGLVDSRKPFIVTGNYIGPERRQIVRGLTTATQLIVPNSLKAKIENKPELDATPENVQAAFQAVNDRRISIYTEEILRYSAKVMNLASNPEKIDERREFVEEMQRTNLRLEKRVSEPEFSHILSLCDALNNLLSRISGIKKDLQEQEKELLFQIPLAIHKACTELRESADLAFDIRDLSDRLNKVSASGQ